VKGRVLVVAGSDSGGGAGMQADIKTVTALGGYAATALTALTAQNTEGVAGIHDVPAEFVAQQMRVVLSDIGADCVKTGMLHRADIIDAVCDVLEAEAEGVPVVVDPVMVAKGGASLITEAAMARLKERMIPLATVLTPNAPEAEALSGLRLRHAEDAAEVVGALAALGPKVVLVKGGHMEGNEVTDMVFEGGEEVARFESERLDTTSTHGTGCTMASAIATGIAQGLAIVDAVARAHRYVHEAIRGAPGFGRGHGPLDHGHTVRPFE
jgi:hydroxymethylpyrimidine/phosphomethylpyrimidine kinase